MLWYHSAALILPPLSWTTVWLAFPHSNILDSAQPSSHQHKFCSQSFLELQFQLDYDWHQIQEEEKNMIFSHVFLLFLDFVPVCGDWLYIHKATNHSFFSLWFLLGFLCLLSGLICIWTLTADKSRLQLPSFLGVLLKWTFSLWYEYQLISQSNLDL